VSGVIEIDAPCAWVVVAGVAKSPTNNTITIRLEIIPNLLVRTIFSPYTSSFLLVPGFPAAHVTFRISGRHYPVYSLLLLFHLILPRMDSYWYDTDI
jgi:hypothetical protein